MRIITSESVFSGHPDKVCDQISDAILDALLEQDENSRVAVETAIKDNFVLIFGEVSSKAIINYKEVAINKLREIGYHDVFEVLVKISTQSADIALGVDSTESHEQGAGDQGIMFGYACKETQEFMPLPIMLANQISKEIDTLRKSKYSHVFGPDGKCQVSINYKDKKPKIETVVVSAQTKPGVFLEYARDIILHEVLPNVMNEEDIANAEILVNPTGEFVIGGPYADSGLTGRKIIVDTYGGHAKHGGGAFSGKDVSKVDRSGAYYARYVAKSIVGADLATQCEVQVSYAIGVAKPVSIFVNTFGTGVVSDEELQIVVSNVFDFRPENIKKELKLDKVMFQDLAKYGHFGREDLDVCWENVDVKIIELRSLYEKA